MSCRSPLPPPPPPAEIRSWPDRETLLADRDVVLGELVRMHVGRGRLGLLWMWGALAALGWSFVGTALIMFEETYDVFSAIGALVALVLGFALLVPSGIFVSLGLGRDRKVRQLLLEWGALDRDPARDRRLRLPGTSLAWLLMSFALCAVGLFACTAAPAGAAAEDPYGLLVLVMGVGLIAWVIGLIGITKALTHRRWVVRVLMGAASRPPVPAAGGAPR
ncbi:hypothetical protein [Streptomyces sp. NPDC001787]|uniref:hypothetical protein n=1 Tax=Streptomyces sp. NPDC001787 TaxID=3154523 RepID=UPI00332B1161